MSVPFTQIGRFEFPVTHVVSVTRRSGWRAWLWPGYDVHLIQGVRLRLLEAEKTQLEDEMRNHHETLKVLGMVNAMRR